MKRQLISERDLLAELENSSTFGLRRVAAKRLGQMGSSAALPILGRISRFPDSSVIAALHAVFYRAEWRALRLKRVREAHAMLAGAGLDRTSLGEALRDDSRTPKERAELVRCADSLGLRELWPQLVRLVAHEDLNLSCSASQAISGLKARSASRSLMKLARVRDPEHVGRFAIDALWWMGEKRAGTLLSSMVIDMSYPENTRDRAAEALGGCAHKPAHVKNLVRAALGSSEWVRKGALCGLSLLPNRLKSPDVLEVLHRFKHERERDFMDPDGPNIIGMQESPQG